MKVSLIKDRLVLVQFENASNFNAKRLTWVPTLNEIRLITDAVTTISEQNKQVKSLMTWKVASMLGISKREAQRYIRYLVQAGYCKKRREGQRVIYDLVNPEELILRAMKFKPFRKVVKFTKEIPLRR